MTHGDANRRKLTYLNLTSQPYAPVFSDFSKIQPGAEQVVHRADGWEDDSCCRNENETAIFADPMPRVLIESRTY